MNQITEWMGGGIVIWTVIGIIVGALLILVISRLRRK